MSYLNSCSHCDHQSVGVLLVNTGTPSEPTPQAVRKYLAQFLMDEHIIPMNRLPWWFILHLFILPVRGRKSAAKYAQIWTDEGSPLMAQQEQLAKKLNEHFATLGHSVMVSHAMSYGEPTIAGAMSELRNKGCARLVVLPLYPQQAFSTTASVRDTVAQAASRTGWEGNYDLVDDYHDNAAYVQAIAHSVQQTGFDASRGDCVLLSYHSVPLKDIEQGDVYREQTEASTKGIVQELGVPKGQWEIAYQCRFDKSREWLGPTTKSVLNRLINKAVSRSDQEKTPPRLFVVCPGFAVDCLETLFDVELELKPYYLDELSRAGLCVNEESFVYVPCLGGGSAHAHVIADVLQSYLP